MWTFIFGMVVLALMLGANSMVADTTSVSSGFIVEYPVPVADSQPLHITVESPGHVWFTMPGANAVGSLVVTSTVDYEFTQYDVPTLDSEPYDLVYDGESIWFTERAANQIGRFQLATEAFTEYTVPTPNSAPSGIDVAPNGDVWFTERDGNQIGRFDPATEMFDEYPYNIEDGKPEDIAVLNDSSVWFTAPGVNRVVEYRPSAVPPVFFSIRVGVFNGPAFPPGGIALDASGPWITTPTENLVGRYAPGTLSFWNWFDLPTSGESPTGIAYTRTNGVNHVWFAETAVGRVGQLAVDDNANELYLWQHSLPSAHGQPQDLAVDSNGHVWITESAADKIAEWRPPYVYFSYLPIILKTQEAFES